MIKIGRWRERDEANESIITLIASIIFVLIMVTLATAAIFAFEW